MNSIVQRACSLSRDRSASSIHIPNRHIYGCCGSQSSAFFFFFFFNPFFFHPSVFFSLSLVSMDPLTDLRRNAYKSRSHFKPEEVRRRRETAQVEIRKQKKEENLAKRRNLKDAPLDEDSDDEIDVGTDSQVRSRSFSL